MDNELREIIGKKFRNLSAKRLIERANNRALKELNTDDELFEMSARRDEGKLKFKANWDTWELI